MAVHGDKSRIGGGCAIATAGSWYREAVESRWEVRWVEVQGTVGVLLKGRCGTQIPRLSDGSRKKLVQRRNLLARSDWAGALRERQTVMHVTDRELGRCGESE